MVMAFVSPSAPSFEHDNRLKIAAAADRLETMRGQVERLPAALRRDVEQDLDRLRGLLNRARARMEGARMAGDNADLLKSARADALTAISELLEEATRLENRLPVAA